MKAKAKYVILFPAFMFATVSFSGGNTPMNSSNNFLPRVVEDISPKKSLLCSQASTLVFAHKPITIDEAELKNELDYKNKLNELSQTVQNFLKIKLKKRKHK